MVATAVGKFVQDPRALDKESDVTEGRLNDLIAASLAKFKEKYSGITEGEIRDMINQAGPKDERKVFWNHLWSIQ